MLRVEKGDLYQVIKCFVQKYQNSNSRVSATQTPSGVSNYMSYGEFELWKFELWRFELWKLDWKDHELQKIS